MAKSLGIIADDLTGSLDTGVQFSKWGLTSLVSLRGSPPPEMACVIMNTDSRAVPPDVAAERVERAARLLRGRLVYKKIDSTLRGNLGAEMSAAMQELGMKKAVVVPAFPANGRTTLGGRLFIRGVPLDQTGFARDPRNAIDESHIPTLLQQQTGRPVGSVDIDIVEQGTEAIREAIARCPEGFVVVDVEIQKHLADIALAVMRSEEAWLPVGSAGLAEALPAAIGLSGTKAFSYQAPHDEAPVLVVAGSRNEVTAAQVREATAVLGLPVIEPDLQRLLAPEGGHKEIARVAELTGQYLAKGQGVIVATCFAPHIEGSSPDIAVALGRLTLQVMNHYPVGGLFLTGGDIALQVCLALDGQALRPVAEVSPGLPISLLTGGQWDGLRIITKAGGFGEKNSLVVGIHDFTEKSPVPPQRTQRLN